MARKVIRIEIEIDDDYLEKWNKQFQDYHTKLYKSEERGKEALENNPLEKCIANEIDDYLCNSVEGVKYCKTDIIQT